ncbi:MAG: cupin domain-containing protein [Erysipelotrichia bacterium]|jgi:quercetin dioxygenase-like cupin family protein|nr:cupin domain-containing protein [Erysipelotrichia bacterium]
MEVIKYQNIEFKRSGWGVKARQVVNIPEMNIMNLVLEPGEAVPAHKTPVHVHFQVMEGKGTIVIGEETFVVGPGDIVFSPKQIPHAVKADQNEYFSIFVIKTPNPQTIISK